MTSKDGIALMKVGVDMRVPLGWVLSTLGAGLLALIAMYYSIQSMGEAVREMQITLRQNQQAFIQLTGDFALVKYRLERLEEKEEK